MFTGIVDHCGEIIDITHTANSMQLTIRTQFHDFNLGESISVNGVCLTVTEATQQDFKCDISPETQQKTCLANLHVGQACNLERALRVGDPLGGHWVTGHVDQTIRVSRREQMDEYVLFAFNQVDSTALHYLITKGSVAINGVSLTVNTVNTNEFSVMLIPHTLEKANLQYLQVGDSVNVEFDMMAKYITQSMRQYVKESEHA